MDKINVDTQVKDWVKIINELVDEVETITYSWDTVSVKGQSEYTFDKNKYNLFPSGKELIVLYAGVELNSNDYKIDMDNKLVFTTPSEEDGCPISVRYLRRIK